MIGRRRGAAAGGASARVAQGGTSCSNEARRRRWRGTASGVNRQSAESDSILVGELMDILNGDRRRLGRSTRILRRGDRGHLQKVVEPAGREHEEVVVLH